MHRLTNRRAHESFTCADINDQREIVCGTDQGPIYQTHAASSEHHAAYTPLIGHTKLVSDLCYYDPNGSYILSCSADNDIRLWRSLSTQCITIYRSHLSPVWCLAVHSKSDRFASGSMDRTVRLWTPDRLTILRTLVHHADDVNTVAFHPNGKYLASGSNDGFIVLWSLDQAQPARLFKCSSPVEQLTFTSTGDHLISTSSDHKRHSHTISIWDIRTAHERVAIQAIPSRSPLLKSCQIHDTHRFVTGAERSLIFLAATSVNDDGDDRFFRSEFPAESMTRLIHVSSNQSDRLVAIVE